MWVYLNNAFLSIVADRDNPKMLLVRARVPGDIERVFPIAKELGLVKHTPEPADYTYRASIDRLVVGDTLYDLAQHIEYPNFKNSLDTKAVGRHRWYLALWSISKEWGRRLKAQ